MNTFAEGFFKLFSIVIGRYFLQLIGACIRFIWFKAHGKNISFADVRHTPPQSDEVVDDQAFKNGLVGFGFITLALALLL